MTQAASGTVLRISGIAILLAGCSAPPALDIAANGNRIPAVVTALSTNSAGPAAPNVAALSAAAAAISTDDAAISATSAADIGGRAARGRQLFQGAFPGTNGRSCATCHALGEHTILAPASVVARLEHDPHDPLFNRIDADDPQAATPTWEHLKKGLVRVTLPLPANMDVIDEAGHVITPADRQIAVWRGVPTVDNTAITGPYQYDGRLATLPEQAQAAISSHSQGGPVSARDLDALAAFERTQFSSLRARFVADLLDAGVPRADIPVPEDYMPLTTQEAHGRDLYRRACEACHGGPTKQEIVNRAVHDSAFVTVGPDGNAIYDIIGGQPVTRKLPHPNDEFIGVGFAYFSYLGQRGQFPTFNASVALPHYRFRFYTDATRSVAVTDLPPLPVTKSGDPYDLTPALDSRGAPIVGPNGAPQWYTTDAGRALITGDPADFEAFDVPTLRGVAHTAPYFHDNSFATLSDVVDQYSRITLAGFPDLHLPAIHPPEFPGGLPESLTPAEKQDLLAFLNRL